MLEQRTALQKATTISSIDARTQIAMEIMAIAGDPMAERVGAGAVDSSPSLPPCRGTDRLPDLPGIAS